MSHVNPNPDIRELTQIELNHLWSGLHKDPIRFANFLRDYNAVVPLKKRIMYHTGKRGRLDVTTVWREPLPVAMQDKLDAYENTLDRPFIGGAVVLTVIDGGLS